VVEIGLCFQKIGLCGCFNDGDDEDIETFKVDLFSFFLCWACVFLCSDCRYIWGGDGH
jgi:hypothetical protein